jgi:putative acetyltransferase
VPAQQDGSTRLNSLAEPAKADQAGVMGYSIRPTGVNDHEAVLAVVREAFARPGWDSEVETSIVARTWALGASPDGLDLVAIDDVAIVGHVLAAVGDLGGKPALGVAPLCVVPSRQSEGIGSALMGELIRRATAGGWPLLLLLGAPDYYQRFGFKPSGEFGIYYRPVGEGNPHFQVCPLTRLDPALRGEFTYCWEAH